jgi:hypothetical protein
MGPELTGNDAVCGPECCGCAEDAMPPLTFDELDRLEDPICCCGGWPW